MFYIQTPNGISITEAGRSPLFVSKSHPLFESIKANIKTMSYNAVQDAIDVKGQVAGVVTENVESYINTDDDLEVQMNVKDLNNDWKEEAVDKLINLIKDGEEEDNIDDKAKTLIRLLRCKDINLVGIKLIFE